MASPAAASINALSGREPQIPSASSDDGGGTFIKSSTSDGHACCVEVCLGSTVAIGDSKYIGDKDRRPLLFAPAAEWMLFLSAGSSCCDGFASDHLVVEPGPDDHTTFRSPDRRIELFFTPDEIAAFLDGVTNHEFDVIVEPV